MDARKTLGLLREEWTGCTSCELGIRREGSNGKQAFGEGSRRGMMFIGEGPGKKEEEQGRPFVGKSGELLRRVLGHFQVNDCYITNVVVCRSCEHARDNSGNLLFQKAYGGGPALPRLRDIDPSPVQIQECLPRLYEEIYLVDPIIIVTLGVVASETLLRRKVTITKEHGEPIHCLIPGAMHQAKITEGGKWVRKIHGEMVMPTEPGFVRYVMLPTLHPAWILRKQGDHSLNNPFKQFTDDIRNAVKIYERYMLEAHGVMPAGNSDVSDEVITQDLDDSEGSDE